VRSSQNTRALIISINRYWYLLYLLRLQFTTVTGAAKNPRTTSRGGRRIRRHRENPLARPKDVHGVEAGLAGHEPFPARAEVVAPVRRRRLPREVLLAAAVTAGLVR
jgi:hypothetical protein